MVMRELTDEQWDLVSVDFLSSREARRGRPRWDGRAILENLMWWMRTGLPWAAAPSGRPSADTCQRRLRAWLSGGTFQQCLMMLAEDLEARGRASRLSKDTSWEARTVAFLLSSRLRQTLDAGSEMYVALRATTAGFLRRPDSSANGRWF